MDLILVENLNNGDPSSLEFLCPSKTRSVRSYWSVVSCPFFTTGTLWRYQTIRVRVY